MPVSASFRCANLFRCRIDARIIRLVDIVMSIAHEQMLSMRSGNTTSRSGCVFHMSDGHLRTQHAPTQASPPNGFLRQLIYHAFAEHHPESFSDCWLFSAR